MVKKIKKDNIIAAVLILAALGGGYFLGAEFSCKNEGMMPMGQEDVYVTVKRAEKKNIAPAKKYIARVEAMNAVDIRPQVAGYIEEVLFEDGSFVKEGDTLFRIEQRKYKANVASAKAALSQAQNDYDRQYSLYKDKMLPAAELEVAQTALEQAKANLELASIDLEHSEIKAPISGKIGKSLITKGNYVDSSTSSLARIVQINPVRISFSLTDKERLESLKYIGEDGENKSSVQFLLANGQIIDAKTPKIYQDNEMNPETATISMYAEYDNPDWLLVPGNLITILVSPAGLEEALLVPQVAVAQDSNGKYVMVVDDNNVAQQRYIQLGDSYEDNYIVNSGIEPGEKIVISGVQKVSNGQSVKSTIVAQ